jgi:predicted nucleic acid-binding protein
MLLDSNIVIYATRPEHAALRQFIAEYAPSVSVISYIEVLGFHRITEAERQHLEQFFGAADVLPLSDAVVSQAVLLRQQRRMSLGDSIIAATALVHGYTLVTRNTDDFRWIPDLQLLDPIA